MILKTKQFVAVSVLAISSVVSAQSSLPNELVSAYGQFGPTETSFLYTLEFDLNPVKARVQFYNGNDIANGLQNNVSIQWSATGQVEGFHFVDKTVSTGFQVTALTRANGKCDSIYVAGWLPATNEVVVEKWKFRTKAYPITTTTFPAPKVVKTEVFRCNSMQPLSGIVRNPNSNELWMLEWAMTAPKRLLSLDLGLVSPDCSSLGVLYDGSNPAHQAAYPLLSSLRSIYGGTHPVAGWIIYLEERPRWRSRSKYPVPYNLLVGFDADLDGALDSITPMSYSALFASFPFSEWVNADG